MRTLKWVRWHVSTKTREHSEYRSHSGRFQIVNRYPFSRHGVNWELYDRGRLGDEFIPLGNFLTLKDAKAAAQAHIDEGN